MSSSDARDSLEAIHSAGTSSSQVRQPAMAGRFYPGEPATCRALTTRYLSDAATVGSGACGAIVPHAGWICSGAVAGKSIATLAAGRAKPPDVVVIFAAIHSPGDPQRALLCSAAAWRTPLGDVGVREDLQVELLSVKDVFEIDDRYHAREHAVEVELPLVQGAWPRAAILPVEVPPESNAVKVGELTADTVRRLRLDVVYLASTDLTHYGPMYDFAPAGVGMMGLEWAKQNDRALLERVEAMVAEEIVPRAIHDRSACGPGAIAAMMSACRKHGATRGRVLQQTSSYETLADVHPQPPTDAVGYAAVVIE